MARAILAVDLTLTGLFIGAKCEIKTSKTLILRALFPTSFAMSCLSLWAKKDFLSSWMTLKLVRIAVDLLDDYQ